MNPCKCSAAALLAILLLSQAAAGATPADEAYRKGLSAFESQDYDAAITAFAKAVRTGSEPGGLSNRAGSAERAKSTRSSPTAPRPSGL